MASNKDFLNKLIAEARQKKFEREQSKDLIKSIGDEVKAQLTPKNVEDVAVNMGNEIKDALVKSIGSLNLNDHVNSIAKGITITSPEVKIPEINVTVPEIKIPPINVPEPRVTVNVPDFPKIPDFPRIEMPNSMEVFGSLDLNYDYKNPLPVRLVSLDGKPYESVGGIMGGGGGGGTVNGQVAVSDILNSSGGSVIDNDGFLKVTGAFSVSATGSTTVSLVNVDGTYYNSDNPLPVTGTFSSTPGLQVSGAVDSVNVVDAFGSTAVSGVFNADNRIRVSVETGGSGLTDTELRASSVPVSQVSGSVDSVNITNASIAVTGTFWQATQPVSGTVAVSGVSGTLGSNIVDSSGVAYSGSNPLPISGSVTASGTVAVSDITNSIKSALIDSSGVQYSGSNPVPVSGAVSQSGTWNIGTVTAVTDITNPIQVRQISGAADSVSIVSITDIFSTTTTSNVVNTDNRVKVELPSFTQAISVTDIFATSATSNVVTPDNRVKVDGSGVTQPVSGTVTVSSVTNTIASNIVDSSGVAYSGTNPVPVVFGASATQGVMWVDSSGVAYEGANPAPVSATQSGTWNVGTVTTVTGITNTVGAMNVDSSGVGYSGSNPLPVTVSGALATSAAVLTRQTNPTAVAADYVPLAADDLGRQLVRPLQVRDLIKTAYVSLTNGTETTLLAATAGSFNDLIMITATNNSTAATQLDIRCTTAGNIIHTMYLPASTGPVGFAPSVPWPQDATGNNWTIDMPDQTGTTVYVSALFSQEV